jgi:hypothetical protein
MPSVTLSLFVNQTFENGCGFKERGKLFIIFSMSLDMGQKCIRVSVSVQLCKPDRLTDQTGCLRLRRRRMPISF